jgi:hypothetical protein
MFLTLANLRTVPATVQLRSQFLHLDWPMLQAAQNWVRGIE